MYLRYSEPCIVYFVYNNKPLFIAIFHSFSVELTKRANVYNSEIITESFQYIIVRLNFLSEYSEKQIESNRGRSQIES